MAYGLTDNPKALKYAGKPYNLHELATARTCQEVDNLDIKRGEDVSKPETFVLMRFCFYTSANGRMDLPTPHVEDCSIVAP